LPTKYVSYAEKFDKNLKAGTCASVGYSVPDGTTTRKVPCFLAFARPRRHLAPRGALGGALAPVLTSPWQVPILGTITAKKFKKAGTEALDAAGATTTHRGPSEVVHESVHGWPDPMAGDTTTVYTLEGVAKSGDCGQVASSRFCSSVCLYVYTCHTLMATPHQAVVHIPIRLRRWCCPCQVDFPTKYLSYAEKFDKNLKTGTCASVGYSVADGTTTKTVCIRTGTSTALPVSSGLTSPWQVPVLGTLTVKKFKKAGTPMWTAALDALQGNPTLDCSFGDKSTLKMTLSHPGEGNVKIRTCRNGIGCVGDPHHWNSYKDCEYRVGPGQTVDLVFEEKVGPSFWSGLLCGRALFFRGSCTCAYIQT
jgi:hypothetical protein